MASRTIAVCSWSMGSPDPARLLSDLSRTGIQAVQLALSPLVQDADTWGAAPELLRNAGIPIVSGMMAMEGEDYRTLESIARTGGVRPDSTWPSNRAHALRTALLAGDLGLELVTFHAGFLPEEPGAERETMLGRLREIAAIFGERRIRLGLETGQESAETLAAVLDELDAPNVGVNFDPANMILYGKGDPVAAIELLAPRVVQAHIKDALPTEVPGTWGREVPVGQGEVDWTAFLRVVDRIGVPCVIEREAGENRIADICAAADQLGAVA